MNFQKEIVEIFSQYDYELTEMQVEQFYTYYNMLNLWNKKFNLTTITAQRDVIVKHFLDSVLSEKDIKEGASVIDIGSGAGFPGIPLKILRNDIQLVLVDSLQKRIIFLKELLLSLEIDDVMVIHERSELLAFNNAYREQFDVCVARAVAKMNTLVEYCSPFIKVFGTIIAYKAKNINEEIEDSKNAFEMLGLKLTQMREVELKEINAQRTLVTIRKNIKTPMEYPRQQNKPKTNPL